MKLIPIILTAIGLASLTAAQDGQSGDGGCNPCDETCDIYTKRGDVFIPRMLEANESSLAWEEGETHRWTKPLVGDSSAILTLTFNCASIPEICNNICFGLFCSNKKLPATLTINRAGCAAARKANLCGSSNPNYCSVKKGFAAGYSCDEYPFASTKEGGSFSLAGKASTRCVPKGQNSSQGGQISGLYRSGQGTGRLADGTQFNVALSNTAGTTGYCKSYPGAPNNCNAFVGDANSAPSQK